MEKNYTIKELMSCVISRNVKDGARVQTGANAVVQRAGFLLAHLHHGPNMRILIGRTLANLYNVPVLELYDSNVDWRAARWGEYIIPHDESFSFSSKKQLDHFAIGAIQVDGYGNSNMIGIGKDVKHLKMRGPGGVGTTRVGSCNDSYFIIINKHVKRVFVEKLDFLSGIGFGDGPDFRAKHKLPGKGPILICTDLCVFDFDEETKRIRLQSVHEGVTVQDVIDNTGFEIIIPENVPVTPPPTESELDILHNRIDPQGVLRR